MAPKFALLSGALPKALSACAGRDRRWAAGGRRSWRHFTRYPCKNAMSISYWT